MKNDFPNMVSEIWENPQSAALIFPFSAIFLSFLDLSPALYPNFLDLLQASSFLGLPQEA